MLSGSATGARPIAKSKSNHTVHRAALDGLDLHSYASDYGSPPVIVYVIRHSRPMRVRPEELDDRTAVHAVNEAAFGTSAEADLVDALRGRTRPLISLVAEEQGAVVGHILFSPVSFPDQTEHRIMGLGPMAVVPEYQRKGIGSALVREGLKRCEDLGCGAIVVVGHPEYYPRFGFLPASRYGITCEYDVPDDAFMVLELQPGFFHGVSGQIRYDELFNSV